MWNKAKLNKVLGKAKPSSPELDPLVSTWTELEALRARLAEDMEDKKTEMERFKEETLWRLNSLSDRTIEIARMEGRNAEARVAQDKAETEAELAQWKARVRERVLDEKILDTLAEQTILRLLPPTGEGDVLASSEVVVSETKGGGAS
ncbi:MAG: hypothetical protein LBJ36_12380 [Synergistaceae bacterium]|jgi:uncharacterized caspase-like protein|nr:hypothetical protein [Synergistaceae bacterium]